MADKRQGKNSHWTMADIGMAAFSAFFMQSPSFLSHQIQLRAGAGHGRSNCETLFGMQSIPSDNHIRDMLDFVEPSSLAGLFDETLAAVEQALGNRPVVVARELTKMHEELLRGTAAEVRAALSARESVRGEITLLIGKRAGVAEDDTPLTDAVDACVAQGMSRMEAIKTVAHRRGLSKREVYGALEKSKGR